MTVITLAFATYLGQVIPGLPAHLVAAAGVLAITGLNLFGIRLTSRVLIGLLVLVVGLLALYSGASLHAVEAGHLAPVLGDKGRRPDRGGMGTTFPSSKRSSGAESASMSPFSR